MQDLIRKHTQIVEAQFLNYITKPDLLLSALTNFSAYFLSAYNQA